MPRRVPLDEQHVEAQQRDPHSLLNWTRRLLSIRKQFKAFEKNVALEYARNADRYRILPDLVIGSRGPVRSILFLSSVDPRALDGRTVAMPTATGTEIVSFDFAAVSAKVFLPSTTMRPSTSANCHCTL